MQSRGNHGKSVQWFIWTRCWIKLAPSSTSPLARVYFLGKFRQRNCFFIFYTTKKVTFECRHQFYRTCWKCHYAAVWEINSTGVIWLVWAAFPNELTCARIITCVIWVVRAIPLSSTMMLGFFVLFCFCFRISPKEKKIDIFPSLVSCVAFNFLLTKKEIGGI